MREFKSPNWRSPVEKFELIPGQDVKSRPAFPSKEAYEQFRDDYAKRVKPQLDKHRLARMKSEEASRSHFVR